MSWFSCGSEISPKVCQNKNIRIFSRVHAPAETLFDPPKWFFIVILIFLCNFSVYLDITHPGRIQDFPHRGGGWQRVHFVKFVGQKETIGPLGCIQVRPWIHQWHQPTPGLACSTFPAGHVSSYLPVVIKRYSWWRFTRTSLTTFRIRLISVLTVYHTHHLLP